MTVSLPDGPDVAAFLGQGDSPQAVALAEQSVPIVTAMVRSYTRGNGFEDEAEGVADDLAAVITTATARLMANPAGERQQTVGPYSVTYGQHLGWSLAEAFVLNRYRRRAA